MQLHQLKPKHKIRRKRGIGRGGKRGTFSGRGTKGQKARAGRKFQPIIRELIKRYPKLRGYRMEKRRKKTIPVSIQLLERKFKSGEIITPAYLLKKGIIRKIKGKIPKVKILGKEKLSKALIIENCAVSKTKKEIIEKAGGTIK